MTTRLLAFESCLPSTTGIPRVRRRDRPAAILPEDAKSHSLQWMQKPASRNGLRRPCREPPAEYSGVDAYTNPNRMRDLMQSQKKDWGVEYEGTSVSPLNRKLTELDELVCFHVQFFVVPWMS